MYIKYKLHPDSTEKEIVESVMVYIYSSDVQGMDLCILHEALPSE
jgi:hypothetical protein